MSKKIGTESKGVETDGKTIVKPSPKKPIVNPNKNTNAKQQVIKPDAGTKTNILDTLPSKGTQNNAKLSPEQQKAIAESGKYHLVKNSFTGEIQWVPKKNAGLFGGIGAKNKPPEGYTGWFKGVDGKMRFEIDDSAAKIVEARNVQSRMGMSPTERVIKRPESTEDVPRSKQIVITR